MGDIVNEGAYLPYPTSTLNENSNVAILTEEGKIYTYGKTDK